MAKWSVLLILSAAQFLMVLDAAVMNVSISQLVEDFDTDVTTIQAVITFYSLVMAALMITGGKVGDILGRKRVFVIGHVVYGAGSFLTAVSQTVPQLARAGRCSRASAQRWSCRRSRRSPAGSIRVATGRSCTACLAASREWASRSVRFWAAG